MIYVNNKPATTAIFIKGGEVITYDASLDINTVSALKKTRKLVFPLEVVYEDDYLAIIYKPAGILTSGNAFKTITNALVQNLKKSTQIDAVTPQPVHRLDYPTTGLLLVGKTAASILALNILFKDKKVAKTYMAVTIGAMSRKGKVTATVDDKEAVSYYEVLKSVPSERFVFLNLVKLSPKTGRRHQLRKHMTAIGNPILGDKDYGKEGLILKGKGLYLHAFSLVFRHPFSNEEMVVEKQLPEKYFKLFSDV